MAIDVLRLDGDSLLDVPLLERKRLLDSVVTPSDLVRVGAYVRPPLQTWIATWRRLGFVGLSYRAANSRYHPGEVQGGLDPHPDAEALTHRREAATVASCPPRS